MIDVLISTLRINVATLTLGRGESCESVYVRGSFVHQKCSNYALTSLLFGLCRFV
jgi:hypothetical protein